MTQLNRSPKIKNSAWGVLDIEGTDASYKDAKLWPGGSREWDWNETGTRHSPGIQVDDVRELVEFGAKIIILSRGRNNRLQTEKTTLDWLEEHQIENSLLQTEQAIEKYNKLAKAGKPVGALIHSTC